MNLKTKIFIASMCMGMFSFMSGNQTDQPDENTIITFFKNLGENPYLENSSLNIKKVQETLQKYPQLINHDPSDIVELEDFDRPLSTAISNYVLFSTERSEQIKLIKFLLNEKKLDINSDILLFDPFFDNARYNKKTKDLDYQDSMAMDAQEGQILKLILSRKDINVTGDTSIAYELLNHNKKSDYVLECIKLVLEHPTFNAEELASDEKESINILKNFILKAAQNQYLVLFPTIYKVFHKQPWFQNLPGSLVFKVFGDLLLAGVSRQTAIQFIQSIKNKDDLKKTKKIEEEPSQEELNLILLQDVYRWALTNKYTKISDFIYTTLLDLANSPEDTVSIIAFPEGYKLPKVPQQEKRGKKHKAEEDISTQPKKK